MGPLLITADASTTVAAHTDSAVDDRLIGLTTARPVVVEQYLAIRRALELAHATSALTLIAITSPTSDDGKTTTAINIATALARNRRSRVLLIDADLRLPSIARRLGLQEDRQGLVELITSSALNVVDVVRPYPAFSLSVLTAGTLGDVTPYELFQSPRFLALLRHARESYDFVVIDTPPVIPVADCRVIEAVVDGFLVVVGADRTPRRLLAETLTVLGPDKSLGLVLNRVQQPFEGAYTEYGGQSLARRGPR